MFQKMEEKQQKWVQKKIRTPSPPEPSCVNSHEIPMEIPEQKFTGLTVQLLMGHLKLRNSILQCS